MTRKLLFFLSLVLTADGLIAFLVPVVVYAETNSLGYSGLSYFITWLPRVILIPIVGNSIDRLGLKKVCVGSDIIKVISCLLVIIILYIAVPSYIFAISTGILGGIVSVGNSQILIAYSKIIAINNKDFEHNINLISRIDSISMITGPVIGMLLFSYGYEFLLIISMLIYALNATFFIISNQIPSEQNKEEHHNVGIRHSFKVIFTKPIIIMTILLAMSTNMFDGIVESGGTAIIDTFMSLPIELFGLIDVIAGLFRTFTTYIYTFLYTKISSYKIFIIGCIISIISSFVIIIFINNIVVFLLFYALNTSAAILTGNFTSSLKLKLFPKKILATSLSLITLTTQSILPIVGLMIFFVDILQWKITYLMGASVIFELIVFISILLYLKISGLLKTIK